MWKHDQAAVCVIRVMSHLSHYTTMMCFQNAVSIVKQKSKVCQSLAWLQLVQKIQCVILPKYISQLISQFPFTHPRVLGHTHTHYTQFFVICFGWFSLLFKESKCFLFGLCNFFYCCGNANRNQQKQLLIVNVRQLLLFPFLQLIVHCSA